MKIYIPLLYSEKVKRPDKKYFLFSILGEDFIILLLSFTFISSHPLSNALGLFLLQISFWCVYEIGYVENDIIGEKFEDKAVLSYNYNSYEYSFQLWQPWVWAFALSLAGILVLQQDIAVEGFNYITEAIGTQNQELFQTSRSLIYWFAFLLVLRFLFHIYNQINKQSRVWFYLLLQACRYCGYLVLLTTNTVGLMLLVSKILTRSIQYVLYRYMGGKNSDWPMYFPRYFFYLLIYLLILGAIAANERNLALMFNYQVLSIVVFCLVRGCKHFQKVFFQFVHVSKDSSNRVT
ncbi:MAG: hypothetical protein AAFO76_05080 [Cyanobacteria bacterium J06607_15]